MSHRGKLTRGLKWYMQRDADGRLPQGVLDNVAKSADVDYYLKFLKGEELKASDADGKLVVVAQAVTGGRDPRRAEKTVLKLRRLARNGHELKKTYRDLYKDLNSETFKLSKPKKVVK